MKLLKKINGYFFEEDQFHLEYLYFYIPIVFMLLIGVLVLAALSNG